jgi:predicted amidohydrolase
MTLRLALWQGEGVAGDPVATVAAVAQAAAEAAAEKAELLVFPEGFLTGYHVPDIAPAALGWVEGALADIGAIAARAGVAMVVGAHLPEQGGLANAAVVLSAGGREIGRYRKRALYGAWENRTFRPGVAPFLFDCADFRVGVAICYDVEFPELVRGYAVAGADLVVAPTALMAPMDAASTVLIPARAMENRIFVGYANRTGAEAGLSYVGLSRICGPHGDTLASAGCDPALVCATLDRATAAEARREADYLADLPALRGRIT